MKKNLLVGLFVVSVVFASPASAESLVQKVYGQIRSSMECAVLCLRDRIEVEPEDTLPEAFRRVTLTEFDPVKAAKKRIRVRLFRGKNWKITARKRSIVFKLKF